MTKLRKTLSKEFTEFYYNHPLVWPAEDVETAKTMLEKCEPDAYLAPSFKETVLFLYVPAELIRWSLDRGADVNRATPYGTALFKHAGMGNVDICELLLERGADVNMEAYDGGTALHTAAFRGQAETIRLLLEHGADPCRQKGEMWGGQTPLLVMLESYEGMMKRQFADTAELLVDEERKRRPIPDDEWQKARRQVGRIGHQYQVFRADWKSADEIREGDEAMTRLYTLFDVQPAPLIEKHDGKETILVDRSLPAEQQFQKLHEYLVPIAGAPLTLQGEVIRIAEAVDNEVSGNGGINWNSSFIMMLNNLMKYFKSGNPLNSTDLFTAEKVVDKIIKAKGCGCWDETEKLKSLAVRWVCGNPQPILL